jgi:hypothetical protein
MEKPDSFTETMSWNEIEIMSLADKLERKRALPQMPSAGARHVAVSHDEDVEDSAYHGPIARMAHARHLAVQAGANTAARWTVEEDSEDELRTGAIADLARARGSMLYRPPGKY